MIVVSAHEGNWRAPTGVGALRVLVADCHQPDMALARRALREAGHATLGARDDAAAFVLIDSADVLVIDPGVDARLLVRLADTLGRDAALVLYTEHYEYLGRLRRSIIAVPRGQITALLDVVAGERLRRRFVRGARARR
jgi:hypothetical protein